MTTLNKKRLLLTTLLSGAVIGFAAAPTLAQSADDDEIVVTGSRIKKKDFTSNAPVATVEAVQFERTGSINTENLLNTLPQTVPGLDRTSNNPGNGSATVDLRGLGSNRTLVLINGQRAVPFSVAGVVDLNTIPISLVQNVEVLTGGASSVYGADAVSGVVNFIYNENFEGLEADIGYQATQKGDAGLFNAGVTMGANLDGGRGNVAVNVSYTSRDPLFQGDRDFSETALFNDGNGGLEPGGSSGIPGTSIFTGNGGFQTASGNGAGVVFDQAGDARPFVLSGQVNDFYNYAPVNFIQLPQERVSFTTLGRYEINEFAEAYAHARFSQNRVDSELAPTPIFQTTTFSLDNNPFLTAQSQAALSGNNTDYVGIGVRAARVFSDGPDGPATGFVFDDDGNLLNACTNCVFDSTAGSDDPNGYNNIAPLIDTDGDGIADTASALLRRRLVEVGPRQTQDDNQSMQFIVGLRGDLFFADGWSYDISLSEGRTTRTQQQNGNVNRQRFEAALLFADADGDGNVDLDANGQPTCAADPGGATVPCSPLNIFGEGNISEDAAAYLRTAVNAQAVYDQTVFQANFSGDLGGFTITGDEIGAAFGIEYIENEFAFDPSQDVAAFTVAGFNGAPPVKGGFDVWSAYGEVSVPVLADLPFAESVTLDLAGRVSDFSTAGNNNTYKIGGDWVVNDQLRFRGNFSTSVRAPNIGELFSPQGENFPGGQDPCSAAAIPEGSTSIPADVAAICAATGVPAGSIGSAAINTVSGQVRTFTGGNPDLEVEQSETITVGFVANPSFIEGLTFSVDYYDIKIEDAIAEFGGGANNVLSTCYTDPVAGGADSLFCRSINRRADGSIDFITLTDQNVAEITTKGVDVAADYSFETADLFGNDYGSVNLVYLGTFVQENDFVAFAGADPIECAGNFGLDCGEPDPSYRHRMTAIWNTDRFSTQLAWRLIGEVNDDDDGTVNTVETIDATSYFDGSTTFDVNDTVALTFGINNIFDENPPVIGDNDEQANTYPATYDVYGRTFFANAKFRF